MRAYIEFAYALDRWVWYPSRTDECEQTATRWNSGKRRKDRPCVRRDATMANFTGRAGPIQELSFRGWRLSLAECVQVHIYGESGNHVIDLSLLEGK